MSIAAARPLLSSACGPLTGQARVPGDKSVSHRALMIGALARGETVIDGLLEGEDVLRTAAAMRALGATVTAPDTAGGRWHVRGVGVGALLEPADMLDMGNAGTGARLLIGLVASHPIACFFTGDDSLRRRPMARIVTPLQACGAAFTTRSNGRLPLVVTGPAEPVPIDYRSPVASAQVKSAILLAGLNIPGETRVIEPTPTRDHSERMLRRFGAVIRTEPAGDGAPGNASHGASHGAPHGAPHGAQAVTIVGEPDLIGQPVAVPADPSSAAFPLVAALLRPGSDVRLPDVGLNPHRTGLIDTLLDMGADIAFENRRDQAGEPVADLRVRGSALKAVEVPADRAPSMIDEYPILAIAAACADGPTVMRGLGELRVKESDRLAAITAGLVACGATVQVSGDDLTVAGTGRPPAGGATVSSRLDHRIAMSFLVLGTAAADGVRIDDAAPIDTSFPGFAALMNTLGAAITDG